MLRVNESESGVLSGVGMDKLKVVIDGDSYEDVTSHDSRDMARKLSTQQGFGNGGMCDQPIIGPVGPDGKMLEGMDAIKAGAQVVGFRAEYTFAARL